MRAIATRLPFPAMIVACVALVVALGGVSYAATVLPKNSVGTAQVKKKAITASKLRKNAVSGAKVKDGTLTANDFGAGQLPAGPQGPKGDPGAAGAPGISGYQIVTSVSDPVNPGGDVHAEAHCPSGKSAIGGGQASGQPVAPTDFRPLPGGTGWSVTAKNMGAVPTTIAAYAVCAYVG
jgi:hypothetical protein